MYDIVVLHYPDVRQANWDLLREAARKRGVRLVTWEPHRLQVRCADTRAWSCYDGEQARPSVVLHRTVAAFQGLVIPALRMLASTGSVVLNDAEAAYRSRDKLSTSIALSRAHVPIVPTIAIFEPSAEALRPFSRRSVIMKPAHGVRGEGIRAFRSTADLMTAWEGDGGQPPGPPFAREHYVVQPLVQGGGSDLRAFVVGGACVALMRRQAPPGEVRANLALGASGARLPLDHPAGRVAEAALSACRLDYGGVDLIEDDDGVLRVLEVDAWAGFAGISAVTGEDVAGAILALAVARRPGGVAT